ncbi:pilus assembly protein CpaB [Nocardioides sp. HDW12B]|uniref:SAF domain-containing protein n=1 Tax=Nocardioides sp. HDW12B TaxID=2714939 RepID=UPI00140E6864|nr:SAF domain-containing protein [Nocardioides sp. HDW12B]QIK65274.1 pilus assembly protein CpaB [Nocardioides sp. HDW12B]
MRGQVRGRSGPGGLGRTLRGVRRAVLLRRRPLAVVLVVVAVLAGIRAASAPPLPTTSVLVASRDLPGGTALTDSDLVARALPPESVPDGSTTEAADLVGRTLAAPLRQGEPVTDVRVVAEGLLAGYPARVAVPLRITDPGSVRLLRVGDRVDVVATDPANGRAEVAAVDVPVVALPRGTRSDPDTAGLSGGALVVLAVPRSTAVTLAGRAATDLLSLLIGV